MNKIVILTNDPSIRAWGYTVITPKGEILTCGCIKTDPQAKKLRIRKGDDTVRRISEINKTLIEVIKAYGVNYLLAELPHGSQSASAAETLGICKGIMQTISDCLLVPLEWYSESDSKLSVLGKRTAEKLEMKKAIGKLYRVPWTTIGYKDEAIADSLGVFTVASEQSATLKILNKL